MFLPMGKRLHLGKTAFLVLFREEDYSKAESLRIPSMKQLQWEKSYTLLRYRKGESLLKSKVLV